MHTRSRELPELRLARRPARPDSSTSCRPRAHLAFLLGSRSARRSACHRIPGRRAPGDGCTVRSATNQGGSLGLRSGIVDRGRNCGVVARRLCSRPNRCSRADDESSRQCSQVSLGASSSGATRTHRSNLLRRHSGNRPRSDALRCCGLDPTVPQFNVRILSRDRRPHGSIHVACPVPDCETRATRDHTSTQLAQHVEPRRRATRKRPRGKDAESLLLSRFSTVRVPGKHRAVPCRLSLARANGDRRMRRFCIPRFDTRCIRTGSFARCIPAIARFHRVAFFVSATHASAERSSRTASFHFPAQRVAKSG